MPKVSLEVLAVVEDALKRYRMAVDATNLKAGVKGTYIRGASQFVRWLDGDFEPGERLKN